MSAFARPFVIRTTGVSELLERIPLTSGASDVFSERWLQEALFAHPKSLPVKEIDPHIGPLIPVCMEIETGSGPADILYVTPTGQVVLVETKLWRNPEARRAVVGQILDYAKQLASWSYEVLDQKAAIAAKAKGNHLLSCLRRHHPEVDEATFVDGVRRSLITGDFLLLIVGDGIQYGAETLVAFLERYGHLRFGLALVEVAAFKLPDGTLLLQPRILAKTELVQRTILIGPSGPMTMQQAAQEEDVSSSATAFRESCQAFWSEFLPRLKLDDQSVLPSEPGKSTNQFFQMPPGGGLAWISAYFAPTAKHCGVYLTFAKAFERGPEVYEMLLNDREAIEKEIGVRLTWNRSGDKVYISVPNLAFHDLNDPADRQKAIDYLVDMTPRMIRTFRPRLEADASMNRR